MSSAASVVAVTASVRSSAASRISNPIYSVAGVKPAKAKGAVQPSNTTRAAQNTASAAPASSPINPQLPMGLLLSVSPPPASNAVATSDYVNMENALRSDNLAGAQQAYLRLQSDLLLSSGGLNVMA